MQANRLDDCPTTSFLWSYEILTEKYFCARQKKRRKHIQQFKMLIEN